MNRHLVRSLTVLIMVLCANGATAQPLADHVPADALIYFGWAGTQTPAPGYDGSRLQAIMDESNFPALIDEFIPAVARRIAKEDPQSALIINEMGGLIQAMIRYPIAFYVGDVPPNAPMPMPPMAVIVQPAADEAKLVAQINTVIQKLNERPGGPPVKVYSHGTGIVALSFGMPLQSIDSLTGGTLPEGALPVAVLSEQAPLREAITAKQPGSVMAMWIDVEGIVSAVDRMMPPMNPQQAQMMPPNSFPVLWPKIRDALYLRGLKRLSFTAGFEDRNWVMYSSLEAPAPRQGLAALLDGGKLEARTLELIPQSSGVAWAGSFDFSRLLKEIRVAVGRFDPEMQVKFDEIMAQGSAKLSVDIANDLIAPLGDQWAFYLDDQTGGAGLTGIVLVNRLRDAEKADRALQTAAAASVAMTEQMIGENDIHVSLRTVRHGENEIHYLSLPMFAPAWAVRDGNLYIALYPQVVASAADHVASGGPSIRTNESCRALMRYLDAGQITALEFIDVPKLAAQGYAKALVYSQLGLGMADLMGAPSPAMVIPPFSTIEPHLVAAGSVMWTDDTGAHSRGLTPFPGAGTLAMPELNMSPAFQPMMMLGTMMPAMGRARMIGNQRVSGIQLKTIGTAMFTWGNEHEGKFPPDLGTLVADGYIGPADVLNPGAPGYQRKLADILRGPEKAAPALGPWANANTDYVYVGHERGLNCPPNAILAYEAITEHAVMRGGINILYGDTHVEWHSFPDATRKLHEAGLELP